MRKILSLMLAVMLVLSVGAFASAEEKSTVTIWTTGSQNVGDLFTSLTEAYNAKADSNYTAKVQFILSGTGDEGLDSRVAAAYKSGQTGTDFDIYAENTAAFQALIDKCESEDILLDVDYSKIAGFENVTVVPVANYAAKIVPYRCTTVVFAYDSARISEEELPHTWDELTQWIKDHPGRFAYNDPDTGGAGKAFVNTAVYRLIEDKSAMTSNDPVWAEQYDAGIQWLIDLHPSMYKSGGNVLYPNKNQGTIDLLINQEVDMIPAWADQILTNVSNGTLPATTCMYQLDDFALSGSDVSLCIPSIGSNVEGAYEFISFVISPEGQKICLEQMKAIPVIPSDMIDSNEKDLVSSLGSYNFISTGNLWSDYLYPLWMESILPL